MRLDAEGNVLGRSGAVESEIGPGIGNGTDEGPNANRGRFSRGRHRGLKTRLCSA